MFVFFGQMTFQLYCFMINTIRKNRLLYIYSLHIKIQKTKGFLDMSVNPIY